MVGLSEEMQGYVRDGLRLCREGEWRKGLPVLAGVIEQRGPYDKVPGIVYSYLGYGVAKFQNKTTEGLRLCEHAIKIEFYEADNHWNLARVSVLAGHRRNAVNAINGGLRLDPDHDGLLKLKQEIGLRRQPILGFLGRDNFLNVLLGRIRHAIAGNPR
ncbi:MAG: hypothetical protein NDJ75_05010 [Thermoanaerobaculia bacterium]|nr:hypothetical protein [Thermoanaerobaculia bacterium]